MKFKHFICEDPQSPYYFPFIARPLSLAVMISDIGETLFYKRCFTAEQAFGRDVKVRQLTANDTLSPDLEQYDYFWVDDGDPKRVYKFNKTTSVREQDRGHRYEVLIYERDYEFGHHNMLKRGHFELTALDPNTVDEDILEDNIRTFKLKLTFDGLGVHKLKNAFDEVACRDEAKQLEIDLDSIIIDSIAYQHVLYEPNEKALYVSANIEFTFKKLPAKSGESKDISACKRAGDEDFTLVSNDLVKKLNRDSEIIDVTRFFIGGIPGA